MSWEDQGRQEHGWFGNGTAPPKVKDDADKAGGGQVTLTLDELDARIHAAIENARGADAAARAYAWAKRFGSALFRLPRSGAVLETFAEEAARVERDNPGSLARTLDDWAARGKFGSVAKATAISAKIKSRQAYHIILNLDRTNVTREQVEALLTRKPSRACRNCSSSRRMVHISRFLPDPEEIAPASSSSPPQAP